ncbi:MAG: ABC transporter permease [Chloroflexota bacterium]|nr:ABC transporter permease [Chloroflexota bacterium]
MMSVTTSATKTLLLKVQQHAPGAPANETVLVPEHRPAPGGPASRPPASRARARGAPIHSGVPGGHPLASLKAFRRLTSVLPSAALGIFILLSWYIGTTYGHISSLFLPAPADVLASLVEGQHSGIFLSSAVVTVQESLLGFLLALALALPLGYGLAKSRWVAITINPYLVAGQAIPAIVIAPVLVLWLGYGLVPHVILSMLVVLFLMVITIALGVQTIDHALIEAARLDGASGWSLLVHIEFPLALPAILAAIRAGLVLSITGALVGEFVSGGDQGLGALILQAQDQYNMAFMFATLIVLTVIAALYYAFSWLLIKLAQAVY